MKVRPANMLKTALPLLLIGGSITLLSARIQTDIISSEEPARFFRPLTLCSDYEDTVPGSSIEKVKEINLGELKLDDLNKIQKDLDVNMLSLEKQLKASDWQLEQEKLQKDIAQINYEKALKEAELSLEKLNLDNMDREIRLQLEKAKKEVERSKKEMKLKLPDMKQIEKELQHARLDIEKGKKEMKELETMLREMKTDGLIDENEDYDIQYKNGDLLINGKQQAKEVTDKYQKYFKDEPVRIRRYKKAPISI